MIIISHLCPIANERKVVPYQTTARCRRDDVITPFTGASGQIYNQESTATNPCHRTTLTATTTIALAAFAAAAALLVCIMNNRTAGSATGTASRPVP